MDMMFVLPWKAGPFGHGNEIEMHRCSKRMLNQTTQIMCTFSGYHPFQATNRQRIHKETETWNLIAYLSVCKEVFEGKTSINENEACLALEMICLVFFLVDEELLSYQKIISCNHVIK